MNEDKDGKGFNWFKTFKWFKTSDHKPHEALNELQHGKN
jgi:hypothetical protein